MRRADLQPPLGWPGGLCHTVERIQEEVTDPRLEDQLTEKVERGVELTNPEAAKVYEIETEQGVSSTFSRLRIGPHAQYRMDLRGVTVGDVRVSLKHFLKQMGDWKSRGDWQYNRNVESLQRSEPVEWLDKKLGDLVVIFSAEGPGAIKLITTYWKGLPDPKGPAESCPVRQASQETPTPGYQTLVRDPHPTKSETSDGDYKERALPSPPWKRKFPSEKNQAINGPGPSGTGEQERSVHKDMARTQGEEGKESPVEDARTTPVRRPGLQASEAEILGLFHSAGMTGPPYPPHSLRQRKQRGQAASYDRKQYRRERGARIRKMRNRYKKFKANTRFLLDRKRRKDHPERFERLNSGGSVSLADRSRKQREQKRSPQQERQQQKYRQAALLEKLPFVWMPTGEGGEIRDVSPTTGLVEVLLGDREQEFPVGEFLDKSFIEEDAFDQLIEHLDSIFGYEPEEGAEDAGEDEPDPVFETWVQTKVAFQVHQRPEQRQHKQRGQAKRQTHRNYMKNRSRYRMQSRKRYQRMKRNPQFKRQQQIRRQHPERFRRKLGQVAIPPDIALTMGEEMRPAVVHSVSPMSEMITVLLLSDTGQGTDLQSYTLDEFFELATPLTPDDEQRLFYLLDTAHGLSEPLPEVPLVEAEELGFESRQADFLYEKRSPPTEPGSVYWRALGPGQDERKRWDRKPGDHPEQPEVREAPGSAKVIPSTSDLVNNKAAVLIAEIEERCLPDLREKARGLEVKLRRVDQENGVWLYDVQGSEPKPYRVQVRARRRGNARRLDKADVFVACSCPFWQWQGPEHWAKQEGYLFGKPRGTASQPVVKDPKAEHGACKHVLAVLDRLRAGGVALRQASLRYLVDSLDQDEMLEERTAAAERVARRYRLRQGGADHA